MTKNNSLLVSPRERILLEKAMGILIRSDGQCDSFCLAKEVGSNRNTLSKIFVKSTGIGPMRWLKEQRLEQARLLVQESDNDITDIAYRLGFRYPSTFSTAYKQYFGVSPRRDRQRHSKQIKP